MDVSFLNLKIKQIYIIESISVFTFILNIYFIKNNNLHQILEYLSII